MFRITNEDFSQKLILPSTVGACPCDNDGVLCDSEPHIQACILQAAAAVCGVGSFTEAQLLKIRGTFGKPDNIMSQELFNVLHSDEVLGQAVVFQTLTQESFVPFFVEARKQVWHEWTLEGRVSPKDGAFAFLNEFNSNVRVFGLVTGMPFHIAAESVTNVLKADEIIPKTTERRVCCDDLRLGNSGKPDPLCYELGIGHFVDEWSVSPRDMVVVEDRANGAVAALAARYHGIREEVQGEKIGRVIVIPDPNDVNPLELWDKKEQMQRHLERFPEDRHRLHFLRSLEDVSFSR